MKRTALFDAGPKRPRWRGSRALVVIDTATCPVDGGPLNRQTVTTAPLFRHGGYGAARRTVRDACRCGWSLVREVSEVRP